MPTDYAIKDGRTVFDATTYTGNGSTQTITNTGKIQPDLVWVKSRNNTWEHILSDSVRGASKILSSNKTDAESDVGSLCISSFNASGFSIGTGGTVNNNTNTYVGWQWKAGGTAVSNTAGSITSSVSANPTAGFSIVTFTTTAGVKTVGHGLGVAPKLIIVKPRAVVADWYTYNANLANTQYLKLNTTDAAITDANLWNSTSPTSSVFTLGSSWGSGNTMVAYCWSEVAGFSKFGSYTGNGSADGSFIYTGFKPKFLMIKCSSSDQAGNAVWAMLDSSRNTYNVVNTNLYANLNSAPAEADRLDFVSNGFKIRTTSVAYNASGANYIYMAFAENPFKYSNAR